MTSELLEEYLDHVVIVHYQLSNASNTLPAHHTEEGLLYDFDSAGILLCQKNLCYIPFHSIQKIEIKARPTLWQRLTGVS
ncbi:hypothetical protein [Brevibacillus laterosporus]|uniref:hypothetical protein n=1 Tax=Brevibacillus laterosporus TaxID=1465 RepID=UPI000839D2D4|nr:hypothetical protein [Brevibacillus laterosporus]